MCSCVCVCVCVRERECICMHSLSLTHTHTHTHKHKHTHTHTQTCTHTHTHTHTYTHTHTHTEGKGESLVRLLGKSPHTHKHAHANTCTHTYTCIHARRLSLSLACFPSVLHSVSFTQTHTIPGSRDFDVEISFSRSLESMYAHLFYFSPSLSLSRYLQSEHELSLFSVALALCALSFTSTLAIARSLPLLKSIVMLYTLQSIPFKVIFSKTLSKTSKLESLVCNILVMK